MLAEILQVTLANLLIDLENPRPVELFEDCKERCDNAVQEKAKEKIRSLRMLYLSVPHNLRRQKGVAIFLYDVIKADLR